jgi:hypothetical protein
MNGQLSVELAIDLNQEEITFHRDAISQAASQEEWQRSAIAYFGSLRQRRSRYSVRRLADTIEPRRNYNAIV